MAGDNGSGKTTIIEALHTTAWGRSFRTPCAQDLIADSAHAAAWRIAGSTHGVSWHYTTQVSAAAKSTIDISGSTAQSCRSIWADFLVITHSADRHALVAGAPAIRRALLFSSAALGSEGRELYKKYHAVYKRRLALIKNSRFYDSESDRPWVTLLWQYGMPLREILKQELASIIHTVKKIAPFSVEARYLQEDPDFPLADMVEHHITEIAPIEYRAKRILMGPQRDDISIEFDGKNARERASRGQQRLTALALDAALAQHAADRYGHPILFSVDDFLSDLDQMAQESAWNILGSLSVQRLVALLPEEKSSSEWSRIVI